MPRRTLLTGELDGLPGTTVLAFMKRLPVALSTLILLACNRDSPTAPLDAGPCQGLSLGGTVRVEGLVTIADAAAANAVVAIGARSARTNEAGAFAVDDAPAGLQPLQVQAGLSASAGGEMLVLSRSNYVRIATARQDQGNQGTLSGRTIDGCSGRPLPGVVVRFPSTSVEATSGPDGAYQFGNLCCSTLGEITASKPGYRTTRSAVGRAYGTGLWLDLIVVPE